MRTSNPILSGNAWADLTNSATTVSNTMTVQGTVNKAYILLGICGGSAMVTWNLIASKTIPAGASMIGLLLACVLGLVVGFTPRLAKVLSPIYAVFEGAGLAGISFFAAQFVEAKLAQKGIQGAGSTLIFQAVILTFGIFFALLLAYTTRILRLNSTAVRCVMAATMGLGIFYLVAMVGSLVGFNIGFIWGSGPIGIGFSLFVIALASFNLVLDFQFIEDAAAQGQPKYMEWYGAFGLLVTLAWLYIEVLRLLTKLKSRD